MTEQKAKLATRKATTANADRVVAGKLKTNKTGASTAAKKAVVKKTAAKKPVAKRTVDAAAAPKKTKASVAKKAPAPAGKPAVKPTPEERYRMVETTAYFIAERNGFQGESTDHWAAAEREIAAKLGQ